MWFTSARDHALDQGGCGYIFEILKLLVYLKLIYR
jgi:hypothetical protein